MEIMELNARNLYAIINKKFFIVRQGTKILLGICHSLL